jgi:hypothetical protein
VGVFKKYGDDRGGQLAALVTFSAFLSFFPLMLVVVTITAFVARRYPGLAEQIRASAVAEFPVVGAELTNDQRALPGSGLGLGVGLAALSWGAFGFTQAIQYAFHEVWHVPHKSRPPLASRFKRGFALLGLLALALVASMVLGLLGSLIGGSRLVELLGLAGACVGEHRTLACRLLAVESTRRGSSCTRARRRICRVWVAAIPNDRGATCGPSAPSQLRPLRCDRRRSRAHLVPAPHRADLRVCS